MKPTKLRKLLKELRKVRPGTDDVVLQYDEHTLGVRRIEPPPVTPMQDWAKSERKKGK